MEKRAKSGNFNVVINLDWCKRCGICSWICPTDAITIDEFNTPIVNNDKCVGCLLCETHCPDFAIEVFKISETAKEGGEDRQESCSDAGE